MSDPRSASCVDVRSKVDSPDEASSKSRPLSHCAGMPIVTANRGEEARKRVCGSWTSELIANKGKKANDKAGVVLWRINEHEKRVETLLVHQHNSSVWLTLMERETFIPYTAIKNAAFPNELELMRDMTVESLNTLCAKHSQRYHLKRGSSRTEQMNPDDLAEFVSDVQSKATSAIAWRKENGLRGAERWSMPRGGLEKHDRGSLKLCAIRELEEETGIAVCESDLDDEKIIGYEGLGNCTGHLWVVHAKDEEEDRRRRWQVNVKDTDEISRVEWHDMMDVIEAAKTMTSVVDGTVLKRAFETIILPQLNPELRASASRKRGKCSNSGLFESPTRYSLKLSSSLRFSSPRYNTRTSNTSVRRSKDVELAPSTPLRRSGQFTCAASLQPTPPRISESFGVFNSCNPARSCAPVSIDPPPGLGYPLSTASCKREARQNGRKNLRSSWRTGASRSVSTARLAASNS